MQRQQKNQNVYFIKNTNVKETDTAQIAKITAKKLGEPKVYMNKIIIAIADKIKNSSGEQNYLDALKNLAQIILTIQPKLVDWQWDFQYNVLIDAIKEANNTMDINSIANQLQTESKQVNSVNNDINIASISSPFAFLTAKTKEFDFEK